MIFWHVGMTLLLFRYVFRDPKVDVRFLALGAILPDLIDKPLALAFPDRFQVGRLFGHTLLFATVLMVVVLLTTRRGRPRRRWMALAIGVMFHLLLDGMWAMPETLFWPFFGFEFPPKFADYGRDIVDVILRDPVLWLEELAGFAYLAYLWRAAGLSDPERRRLLWRTGRLITETPATS